MKAIILLNGEPHLGKIADENAYVFCCDGAYKWAKGKVRIDETLGDFDSLDYTPDPPPSEVYPSEKDYTDGEIALLRAAERGFHEIEIYGGGGKREDHFLGNLHLLYSAHKKGVKATLVDNRAKLSVHSGMVDLGEEVGKTVSCVPFGGDVHIIEGEGLKYPVDDLTLSYGSSRGISNVVLSEEAYLLVGSGTLLLIVNDDLKGE